MKKEVLNNKPSREEKIERALDVASVISAIICAVLVVEFAGIIFLKAFNYPTHGFIYNFIFGFGVIVGIAFICAVLQDLFEK